MVQNGPNMTQYSLQQRNCQPFQAMLRCPMKQIGSWKASVVLHIVGLLILDSRRAVYISSTTIQVRG